MQKTTQKEVETRCFNLFLYKLLLLLLFNMPEKNGIVVLVTLSKVLLLFFDFVFIIVRFKNYILICEELDFVDSVACSLFNTVT